jgi:hypothetical protein
MSDGIQFSARRRWRSGTKGVLLRRPKTAKSRISLRVPSIVMGSVRRLSRDLGIPPTELCELLISFASTANFLHLEKQEGVDDFLSSARLHRTMNAFGSLMGGHEPRTGTAGGKPISLRFPAGFLMIIGQYAKLTGYTQSALLHQFLEQGVQIYMRGWVAVVQAVTAGLKTVRSEPTPPANSSEGAQDGKPVTLGTG